MNNLYLAEGINNASKWIVNKQNLLVQYSINIFTSVIILIIGIILSRIINNTIKKLMKIRQIDITITNFLSSIARYSILIFTFTSSLECIGVQTISIITMIGAAGLAIALALQNSLSNFASGLLLIIFGPLRVGEYVDLGGIRGTINQIQIFTTTLLTSDNKTIIIPNSKIIVNNIINYSRAKDRRVDISINVAYNSDIDIVKKLLKDVIVSDKRIIRDKAITIRLKEMAPSSLNFLTSAWTTNIEYRNVYFDLIEKFKKALDNQKICIPFQQLDVNLYSNNKQLTKKH